MRNTVRVLVATGICLNCLPAFGKQAAGGADPAGVPEQHTAAITVNAREVLLDVVVLDAKGHSVTGLKSSDFQLIEDGEPQAIRDVNEHHAMTSAEVAKLRPATLPPNGFTNAVPLGNTNSVTVVLIDALDSPLRAQMYLREQLIAFMKTVPPGNLFAVFQMDNSMHLVQGFTADPAVLLKAVESKRDRVVLPELLVPGNKLLRERIMNQGLRTMEQYLAAFPGRKNLVWFTADVPHTVFGLTRNPFPDSVDYDNISERPANALSLSRIAVYPIDDRGVERYSWSRASYDELEKIARATGGKAFYSNNGLRQALAEITATSSNYYTIAYSPTNPVWNAHHRNVELTVPGSKTTLLYRHQYYARKERKPQRVADAKRLAAGPYVEEQAHAQPPPAGTPDTDGVPEETGADFGDNMALGMAPAGELLFDVGATPGAVPIKLRKGEPLPPNNFLREDLQSKPFRDFRLLFTVDPTRLSFSRWHDGRWHAEVEFVEVLYDPEGEIVNSLASTSDFSCDDTTYQRALKEHMIVRSEQTIAVPEKGNYFLRLGVHDTVSHLVGTLEVPVDNIHLGIAGPGQQAVP